MEGVGGRVMKSRIGGGTLRDREGEREYIERETGRLIDEERKERNIQRDMQREKE